MPTRLRCKAAQALCNCGRRCWRTCRKVFCFVENIKAGIGSFRPRPRPRPRSRSRSRFSRTRTITVCRNVGRNLHDRLAGSARYYAGGGGGARRPYHQRPRIPCARDLRRHKANFSPNLPILPVLSVEHDGFELRHVIFACFSEGKLAMRKKETRVAYPLLNSSRHEM
jgi:hypothetical protein